MKARDWLALCGWTGLALAAGVAGSVVTTPAIPTWYAQLTKPGFTPPDWVFAPVWTLLFVLMGMSSYLVWTSSNQRQKQRALRWYIVQLVVNVGWSLVFFGGRSPVGGLATIVVLWVLIGITVKLFGRINRTAGWLLVPYWAWVSFAALLNLSIVALN